MQSNGKKNLSEFLVWRKDFSIWPILEHIIWLHWILSIFRWKVKSVMTDWPYKWSHPACELVSATRPSPRVRWPANVRWPVHPTIAAWVVDRKVSGGIDPSVENPLPAGKVGAPHFLSVKCFLLQVCGQLSWNMIELCIFFVIYCIYFDIF